MKYFSANQILLSLIFSMLFGIAAGGLYKSASCTVSGVRCIFKSVISACKSSSFSDFNDKKQGQKHKIVYINQNIFDFFFFTTFGILYIILCYITLDGVFRIYTLIFSAASFFISKNTLGTFFTRVINFIFGILTRVVFIFFCIVTLPLKVLIKIIVRLMSAPTKRFIMRLKKRRSTKLMKKKRSEAEAFFKGISIHS